MSHFFRFCFGVIGPLVFLVPEPEANEPLRSRRDFVQAINKVEEGMPADKVVALLGKPDDMRTHEDHGGAGHWETLEVWRYGTSGHLTVATLGEICISIEHKVQHVHGQGKPPDENLPEESELRALLTAIGKVTESISESESDYNPRPVIQAVNRLQPLGKKKALAVIDEYLRMQEYYSSFEVYQAVNFIMHTLFETPTPPGYMPSIALYSMRSETLENKKLFPRFPIAIEGDIPYLVGFQWGGFGGAVIPTQNVAYFRKHGTIRAKPLVPVDNPFAAIEKFVATRRWQSKEFSEYRKKDGYGRCVLEHQALNLLNSVYQVEFDQFEDDILADPCNYTFSEEETKQPDAKSIEGNDPRIAEASQLAVRWNADSQQYTLLDGTFLPPLDPNRYRRKIWKFPKAGPQAQVIFERYSRNGIVVMFEEFAADRMTILNVKTGEKLSHMHRDEFSGSHDIEVRIAEGEQVQAVARIRDDIYPSPVFVP